MRFNRESCAAKYARLDALLGGDAVAFVERLMRELAIPRDFRTFRVKPELLPLIVEESLPSGSLQANPREATREDCTDILKALL
jgi:alcohol dehydrogenase class IV